MKETDKKRSPNNNQSKRSAISERRDQKFQEKNLSKTVSVRTKETESKASSAKTHPDSNTGENVAVNYINDSYKSKDESQDSKPLEMVDTEKNGKLNDYSSDLEKETKEMTEEESDSETINDSLSSQGDPQTADDVKVERASRVPLNVATTHSSRAKLEQKRNNSQIKASRNSPKKVTKSNILSSKITPNGLLDNNSKNMKVHPNPSSESSEGVDDKPIEEVKEADILDEASNGAHSVGTGSEDDTVKTEENGDHDNRAALGQKIEEMEMRIEKLEEELREVASLEISLYSVVPEHGSSAHKVHTPARRLSRLYIHACKHWSQNKRATIARNTVSGLVLIAKSCGNDLPRLSFWLSNTVVLREIIAQTFGNSSHSSSLIRIIESNGGGKKREGKSTPIRWQGGSSNIQPNKHASMKFIDDWQETTTFTGALEKVESWIFGRMVESIWWQTLTPNMQSPVNESTTNNKGDQQQGSFSINLWRNAFHEALKRLCPVRAEGHECGCLPVLARMVMEQCISRLDVAMFNAILRESAHEIPTDPVSDPILDSKVLPIPAGDLSFGSGAQLKNSVGSWSRSLSDLFGMDADTSIEDDPNRGDNEDLHGGDEQKYFHLLNSLSDLLMLPKDMLIDRSIRAEVCPSISLSLLKRILCNFTPDEFCPDAVPGTVLEALNAESIIERRISGDSSGSFPYTASPVVYTPPPSADVAEKVAEAGGKSPLARSASVIQRKGYTSDEELEELDSPITSIIDKFTIADKSNGNGKSKDQNGFVFANSRYGLLREVWLA